MAVLSFSAMVLITAAFVDGSVRVQQAININAPAETVWSFTSSITALNSWNAWFRQDEMMKTSIGGNDGHPGATFCWESRHAEPGTGCLTISKLTVLKDVTLNITLQAPYKTHAKAHIILQPQNDTTRVTLNINTHIPYPFNIVMLFKKSQQSVATDCTLSLQELKRLSEAP